MGSEDAPTAGFEGTGAQRERVADASPPIAAGRVLSGRYRLVRRLGYGGMAAVWLATDERLDRSVAIKVLADTLAHDADYLTRFQREARVVAGLAHPGLVQIYDFDAGARPYLVMEYVPGGDLAERVSAGETPDHADLARELLEALRHIHAAGVLHRDIKPQNVLIDAAGHARLTDFGIALPRDATALTQTGRVIGTERYMAPEVVAGRGADERSDLFALGMVLKEVAGDQQLELTRRLRDPVPGRRPISAAAALAMLDEEAGERSAGTETQPFAVLAADEQDSPGPTPAGDGPETWADPPAAEPVQGRSAEPPTEVLGSAVGAESAKVPAPRPFEPSPTGVRRARGGPNRLGLLAVGVVIVALIAGLLLSSGGDDDPGSASQQAAGGGGETSSAGSGGGETSSDESGGQGSEGDTVAPPEQAGGTDAGPPEHANAAAPATSPGPSSESTSTEVVVDGTALNDEGKSLIDAGQPAAAVPVLEQAVEALRDSGDELTYNYALFNLAQALRLSGRPEEAIPLLEERLLYDDQTEAVQAELDLAREEAGVEEAED